MNEAALFVRRRWFTGFAGVLASFLLAVFGVGTWAQSRADQPAGESEQVDNPAPDRLLLKSGKVVDGRILEESETGVVMLVYMSGISARTTYPRAEIAEIRRGVNPPPSAKASRVDAAALPVKPRQEEKGEGARALDASDPTLTRLYVVELKGRFAFDISETPLRRAFEEADKFFNDLIPGSGIMEGKKVVDPARRDLNMVILKVNCFSEPGFGTVFQTEKIAPIVKEQIVDKGRRVVFWVRLATGGAAVLPFISPDMYFTPDGKLGGIADLDEFSSGDKMVDEKLISAFMGHAEGFAIKGGYGEHIPALRAMLRKHLWLLVRFEGGRPIYSDRNPKEADSAYDWVILSDDAEGDNKDKEALRGNDLFLLEPDWAEKLGISDGTAETIDDLAFHLGVHRHYEAIESNKGQKAVDDWKKGLEEAIKQVNRQERPGLRLGKLWRDLGDIEGGSDFNERKRNRGRKMAILRQIRAIVAQFGEVLDPQEQWRAQIDGEIAKLRLEAEQDARDQRQGG